MSIKFIPGWKPDIPDIRDIKYSSTRTESTPDSIDLRPKMPEVYNQEALGSCSSNAIGAALEYDQMKQGLPINRPSRLFIYYNERLIEGTTDRDSGAYIRDGFKSIGSQGFCSEVTWPYIILRFFEKPPEKAYQEAQRHKALRYERVTQSAAGLERCLADGFPLVFGMTLYDSFTTEEVGKTGIVPMPKTSERMLGGHAMLVVGYSKKDKQFIVRNSWSKDWGIKGYCMIPYDYLTSMDLAADFWCVKLIS